MIEFAKPVLLTSLRAEDVMSRDLLFVPQEMSLAGAARMMSRAAVSGAPVVDSDGRCVGVLSTTDFLRCVERGGVVPARSSEESMCSAWQIPSEIDAPPGCLVRDAMTRDPVTVAPGTRLPEVARMMLEAHIHRVVVVDGAGRPVGVVSTIDVLAALVRADVAYDPEPAARDAPACVKG